MTKEVKRSGSGSGMVGGRSSSSDHIVSAPSNDTTTSTTKNSHHHHHHHKKKQHQSSHSQSARDVLSFYMEPGIGNKAVRYAIRVHEEMTKRSTLLKHQHNQHQQNHPPQNHHHNNHHYHHDTHPNNHIDTTIVPLERDEVIPYIGDLLGKGGFNSVYEIDQIVSAPTAITTTTSSDIEQERDHPLTEQQQQKKVWMQQHVSKLAIKFLSSDAYNTIEDACNGSADLFMEAQYLSALSSQQRYYHPNIIQIHGIAAAGPQGLAIHGGYFIILDRLYDTLDRRIDIWKELQRRKINALTAAITGSSSNSTATKGATATSLSSEDTKTTTTHADDVKDYLKVLFIQRLLVAYEIISALHHLHSHSIIFRDLKPDNIGFDIHNKVKIFDFGLAKELDPKQMVPNTSTKSNPLYVMSGGTGSRRFMAPEVALSQPYGVSADLYSFSIVAWEIFALEKAFGRYSVEEHQERVIRGSDRPTIPNDWTIGIKEVLTGCWDRDTSHRPCSGTVQRLLQKEISNMILRDFPAQAAAIKSKEGHK